MAQAGLHAIIGYHTNKIIPNEKHLMPGVVFGSMLPDIDVILVAFGSLFYDINNAEKLFHRTFTHNIFLVIFIKLKNKKLSVRHTNLAKLDSALS